MSNITSRTLLSLAIFVVATGFVMPQQAKADTFIVSGWDGPRFTSFTFNVGVDKSVYKPGERVIATAESLYLSCSNYNFATIKATISGATKTVLNIYGASGSVNFTTQSTPGNYFAVFTGTAVREGDRQTLISADAALTTPLVATMSIPYTVSAVLGSTTGGTNTGGPIPGGTNTGGGTIGGPVAGGSITGTTITGGTITGTTITGGTNTSGTITGGTITTGPNTGRTITGGTITGGTITGGTITGGTNTGGVISGGTVTGGTISGGTVTGGTLSGGSTTGGTNTGGPIPGGTNTGGGTIGGPVAGGSITGTTITGGTITGTTITGGTNTSGTITGGTITTGPNTGRTITGGTITGGTITGGTITGGTNTGGVISGGTVTGGTISGGTVTGGTLSGGLPTPTPTPPPTVSISATPNRVIAGNNTVVSWVASNVTSCNVTKNGARWQTLLSDPNTRTQSKSITETITAQTTYVITCSDGVNQNVASAIVNVTSVFQGF